MSTAETSPARPRKWYHWYAETDTPEERKLIFKLDMLIVPYAILVYWVKYMDQTNINNAYVAGLKEELGFAGNQLVHLQTIYVVGAVIGQLPFGFIFPYVPMSWLLPALDIGWGVFNLAQFKARGYSDLMAFRFMIGFFESAFFPGVHYVLGSWYRGDEVGRRGGLFYIGLTLGTLTSGLIQSGASSQLDGKGGMEGWRWMFVITSVITLVVGVFGIVTWPGTPDRCTSLFLSAEEIQLSKDRLSRHGHQIPSTRFTWKTLINIFTRWRFWVLTFWDILFWNACNNTSTGGFLLFLKSLGRYSDSKVNALGSIPPALGVIYIILICFGADLFRNRAGAITVSHLWNAIGLIILTVWNVPESAKWFAFMTTYSSVAMSSVLYGWANDILKHDVAERSLTLTLMNAIAQSTTAWTPLLVFKTVEAPRFPKGYPFTLGSAIALIAMSWGVKYFHDRQE
ncbi:MFS general substrate transporter [Xylona heveae TC161]|uniref:MFS general substrate transporter n=1 Tax=Xylona heveae (strain CBS 132557 / TC161) TaxID=1328760 RepID=A0A164ZCA5_XYLHT|nr:MFS general substrate transporter [Xylona heveae TC161]KZF18926.1 MFS general substrate transporter [Xylona heveae TC161]